MDEWKALVGRISLFQTPSSVPQPSAVDLYRKCWRADPTNFQGAPTPLAASMARGRWEDFGTSCAIHPSRIDLTLTAHALSNASDAPTLDVIENGAQLYAELERMSKLVADNLIVNPIVRVAIFLQFTLQKANWSEANAALMDIVPDRFRVQLTDEEEFSIKASNPRTSKTVENLKWNLITKWSVDRMQKVTVRFPTGGVPVITPQASVATQVHEFISANVSFDFNNVPVPTDRPLTSAQQSNLLLEGLSHASSSISDSKFKVDGFAHG